MMGVSFVFSRNLLYEKNFSLLPESGTAFPPVLERIWNFTLKLIRIFQFFIGRS
ncbi:hypothetical protein AM1BK_44580 [Neobacillus kokaensis]|uniref:Uncharacterized protein n=1 Tax=Neobacillus kokaensis TaxID=2759023 RepID=A0ABQ3NAM7_9BACI|nr:hypothetical protein AM1BK_44580 [Neobacillus kokaensis]